MVEMLMQSTENEITLLPALPDAWKRGEVSGICARGGFEVSMSWSFGVLDEASILNKSGDSCRVKYGDRTVDIPGIKDRTTLIKF